MGSSKTKINTVTRTTVAITLLWVPFTKCQLRLHSFHKKSVSISCSPSPVKLTNSCFSFPKWIWLHITISDKNLRPPWWLLPDSTSLGYANIGVCTSAHESSHLHSMFNTLLIILNMILFHRQWPLFQAISIWTVGTSSVKIFSKILKVEKHCYLWQS
jgi:hypothetical protein